MTSRPKSETSEWVVEKIRGRPPRYYGHRGELSAADAIDARRKAVRLYAEYCLKKGTKIAPWRDEEEDGSPREGLPCWFILREKSSSRRTRYRGVVRLTRVPEYVYFPEPSQPVQEDQRALEGEPA